MYTCYWTCGLQSLNRLGFWAHQNLIKSCFTQPFLTGFCSSDQVFFEMRAWSGTHSVMMAWSGNHSEMMAWSGALPAEGLVSHSPSWGPDQALSNLRAWSGQFGLIRSMGPDQVPRAWSGSCTCWIRAWSGTIWQIKGKRNRNIQGL